MKLVRSLFVAGFLASASAFAAASSALPEFRGILSLGGEQRFSLSSPGGTETAWVTVGESFGGYEVAAFKPADETIVLKKNGAEFTLKLLGSQVKAGDVPVSTKATLADADEVMRKMNFDVMIKKMMDQQRKAAVAMTKQMISRMGADASDSADIAAHQEKVMAAMFKAMDIEGMQGDFTRIYSEVFSKEELRGYSEFLSTPSGQAMVDKQPDVQQKMMEVIQPRMMSAMPEIQKLSMEFAQQMQAKKAAQKAAAAAAGAPAATGQPKP